jgi:hypothetical protein
MKLTALQILQVFTFAIILTFPITAQETKNGSSIKESPVSEVTETTGSRFISGVYPHLTVYSQSRVDGLFDRKDSSECGIGAIVPWAGQLWMVTYAPHMPHGSDHKLYSVEPQTMKMTIHKESVGGTPAGRMIHTESKQLFIGHHAINEMGEVRTIQPKDMPGRVTAWARHLTDPANLIYMYDMEGMLYEVNVNTLAVRKLFNNPVPGEHGKGAYTSQGRLVVANNGKSGAHDPKKDWVVTVPERFGPEDRGILATFDGKDWQIIEQRQYTDVTGPDGVAPTQASMNKPIWAIGWDKRSLRLQVLDNVKFHTYLLPKGCLNNDAAHGWFTEWPRIREIDKGRYLMDMHGMFFDFPGTFRPGNTAGIAPVGRHLRYIPDFCDWNGRLVLATDETSIQGNPLAGQPQSNLWFGKYDDLNTWGEASAAGSIWIDDPVNGNEPSAPFLFNGFARRVIHLATAPNTSCKIELDINGDNRWSAYQTIAVGDTGYVNHIFPEKLSAQWVRVTLDRDNDKTSVAFHYSDTRSHDPAGPGQELFSALADTDSSERVPAVHMFPAKKNRQLEIVRRVGDHVTFAELNAESFKYASTEGSDDLIKKATVKPVFTVDDASVVLRVSESIDGKTWKRVLRLPKGSAAFDHASAEGWPRDEREIESERTLANIHGTFYEVPFWIVGQSPLFTKMKPVCSHNKRIDDFATWRGLLWLSGVKPDAPESEHVIKSSDNQLALWAGGVDELWKLGKPIGKGGPWKNTSVKAGIPSDPYLMNGYDHKTLTLQAGHDCTVHVEVDFDLHSGFHRYASFELKANQERTYVFPSGFAAHWVRLVSTSDTTATAWLIYE